MNDMFRDCPDMMTVEQMAKALHIGRNSAYRLVRDGSLSVLRFGAHIRIPKTFLIAFVLQSATQDRRCGA